MCYRHIKCKTCRLSENHEYTLAKPHNPELNNTYSELHYLDLFFNKSYELLCHSGNEVAKIEI